MTTTVRRDDQHQRYELRIDGELVGVAEFVGDGPTVVLPHTEIVPSRRGHGLGAVLVKAALDDLRARGARVVPACWYVRDYFATHPEEGDLLAP